MLHITAAAVFASSLVQKGAAFVHESMMAMACKLLCITSGDAETPVLYNTGTALLLMLILIRK